MKTGFPGSLNNLPVRSVLSKKQASGAILYISLRNLGQSDEEVATEEVATVVSLIDSEILHALPSRYRLAAAPRCSSLLLSNQNLH